MVFKRDFDRGWGGGRGEARALGVWLEVKGQKEEMMLGFGEMTKERRLGFFGWFRTSWLNEYDGGCLRGDDVRGFGRWPKQRGKKILNFFIILFFFLLHLIIIKIN